MSLIASLDIGSEKMTLALGILDLGQGCRLAGIKTVVSQGVQQGVITDRSKAMASVRYLMNELVKERHINRLNVALSGSAVEVTEQAVEVPVQRKAVECSDLFRAEQRCADLMDKRDRELIDLVPTAYSVEGKSFVADPIGIYGRSLTAYYQAYTGDVHYLSDLRRLLEDFGPDEIDFFPLSRVYGEALDIKSAEHDTALIDLGASQINVMYFRDGMLQNEAVLPLGVRTVDLDIASAFGIDVTQARQLKHDHGQALRSLCKNKKTVVPNTKLQVESRDLVTVIQSRMEELLEGAVYLLQQWGFDDRKEEIVLTGGGSRMVDADILLDKISGHPVVRAQVKRIDTAKEEMLYTPEYLVALGLLLCRHEEQEEKKGGIMGKLKGLFG